VLSEVLQIVGLKDGRGESTASTTWVTAGSVRSANCWKTSTASACCACESERMSSVDIDTRWCRPDRRQSRPRLNCVNSSARRG
jgi:hypothetical protein